MLTAVRNCVQKTIDETERGNMYNSILIAMNTAAEELEISTAMLDRILEGDFEFVEGKTGSNFDHCSSLFVSNVCSEFEFNPFEVLTPGSTEKEASTVPANLFLYTDHLLGPNRVLN